MTDLVIIGGGMCGLVLAGLAGESGFRTILLEKTDRVGKKILATGNGRCNLANRDFSIEHFHGSALEQARRVFELYGQDRIEAFWEENGITYLEEDGRCYPRSLQASSVLNVLRRSIDRYEQAGSVKVLTSSPATKIVYDAKKKVYRVTVRTETNTQNILEARNVVLTTGGKASPRLGSAGEGLSIAEHMGIRVTDLRPGLCRLLSKDPMVRRLAGVRIKARVSLICEKEILSSMIDEILFTDDGISGPVVIEQSRLAGDMIEAEKKIRIGIDLCEEISKGELFALLEKRFRSLTDLSAEDALEGFIHKKLIPEVLRISGIDRKENCGKLNRKQLGSLAETLKDIPVTDLSLDSFREAQVTIGGIAGEELGDGLMSRKYPGLFFGGEIVDLDGDCGGYNLMWAVASALWIRDHLPEETTNG